MRFTFIEKNSLLEQILGNIFLFLGIFSLVFINIKLGDIFILLWLLLVGLGVFLLSTYGIEIDFQKRTYKKFEYVLGLKIGFWEYIPKSDYISIFRTKVVHNIKGGGFSSASAKISEKIIVINLLVNGKNIKTLYKTKNKLTAIRIANLFEEYYLMNIINKLI